MLMDTRKSPYAKVSFPAQAHWTRGFLKDRQDTIRQAAIPHILSIFDDADSFFHEVENFRIAAGLAQGEFRGNPFGDGDFYKLLEAMASAAPQHRPPIHNWRLAAFFSSAERTGLSFFTPSRIRMTTSSASTAME